MEGLFVFLESVLITTTKQKRKKKTFKEDGLPFSFEGSGGMHVHGVSDKVGMERDVGAHLERIERHRQGCDRLFFCF